jgi:co-chaperonin GroES (HSP10)
MEGTLVAVSPLAFNYDDWPEGAQKPRVGDRVLFSKYNATEILGADGRKYWIMKDRSIAAVMHA